MDKQKSAADKLHSYRSDKNKQFRRSRWANNSSGINPKGTNSNNQIK